MLGVISLVRLTHHLLIHHLLLSHLLGHLLLSEEHGTWPTECISKYYKLEPSTSLLPLSHNQTPEGQKFLPFSFLKYFLDYECYTRKGVGKVRFSIPLNVEPGSESLRNISVDIYTTHTHSDEKYTGQASDKRENKWIRLCQSLKTAMQKWSFLGEISMIIHYQVKRSGNQKTGSGMRGLWDWEIGDWYTAKTNYLKF